MARLVHVGFHPIKEAKTKELEPWFANLGDWIRYSATGWIVWTNYTPQQISSYLRQAINPEDQLLAIYLDASAYDGWMPPWVWNWIASKQQNSSLAGALGLINSPPSSFT